MISKGLIVRLEAKEGREATIAAFLRDALPLVDREPLTVAWFGLRLGESSFAIVDFFADETGLQAHLQGAVAAALAENAGELLTEPPQIDTVDVIAAKVP